MIDIRQKSERVVSEVRFEEIRIGDCFYEEETNGLWFKTADDMAACLEDGSTAGFSFNDRVTEVNVEVRWELKTV